MPFLQNTNMLMHSFLSFVDVDDDYDEDGEQAEDGYHDLIDTSMKQNKWYHLMATSNVLYVKLQLWLFDFCALQSRFFFPYLKKANNLFLLSGLAERDDESLDADLSVRKTKQ